MIVCQIHWPINGDNRAASVVVNSELTSYIPLLSTVWDSAIVLAKYLEKWPGTVVGKQCIELGAGCGLAGADQLLPLSTEITFLSFYWYSALVQELYDLNGFLLFLDYYSAVESSEYMNQFVVLITLL